MGGLSFDNVDELKAIKYAAVSLRLRKVSNSGEYQQVCGLFMGLSPLVPNNTAMASKDELYIWISNGENIVQMLNVKHYGIDRIYIGKDNSEWHFNGKEDDLKGGKDSRLVAIHDAMKAASRISPNGLIDTWTYSDVKEGVKKLMDEETVTNRKSTTTGHQHNRSGGTSYGTSTTHKPATSHTCGYSTVSTYKKKEVSTRTFKRTTRYNVADAIEAMRSKIAEIQNGTYEAPKVKPFRGEKKDEKEPEKKAATTSTGNASTDIEEAESAFYGYCM